ncbi:MAG: dihydrodipicolinate synthase family protein [Rhodospirillales bacterium]|jgi:dihydrodipicolinate synthase/N-acetylneuraminate lyase|nr:dihydrodipicolinate synthase family protein [Rhodospirillales bacterium]MDP7650287.1 dihydrodipicolinate synthase family protein [Rhodospirillales bacterium]
MKTTPVTAADLTETLMSVPPLARNADLSLNEEQNRRLVAHLEMEGITNHLYGGNANFYGLSLRQYAEALELLADLGGEESWFIPSIGPDYGKMTDQAVIAKETRFPTFITLPQAFGTTPAGVDKAIRELVQTLARPIILYLKTDPYLTPDLTARLVDDGQVCGIKYGTNRPDSSVDPMLDELVKVVDRDLLIIVGERPAVAQHRTFGLGSMMSGSATLAPAASVAMFAAMKRGDYATASAIWAAVEPLEDLRDAIGPITVLHDAVTLTGIAEMGPVLPLVTNLADTYKPVVEKAAKALVAYNDSLAWEPVKATA